MWCEPHKLLLRLLLLALLGRPAASCWGGGLTEELCCDLAHGPQGHEACWDEHYTYEMCCPKGGPAVPSEIAQGLKRDPSAVPGLPLLGGGSMPMSGIGLCCRPTAQGDAVRQSVVDYLSMGGRHLDDAQIYNNHREVGLGIRQAIELGVPRSEIFLTTKIQDTNFGFEAASRWVSRALEELGVDYIDLVLLHWAGSQAECGTPKACRQETWLALQRAQARGLIKHLGVSNFGERQISELNALGGTPVEVNQIEFHPWVPRLHLDTAQWCHERGIIVTAYGSMGSHRMADQMMMQEVLQQIGQMHGKTPGQVLLRWAVEKNVSVIPGTGNPKHMAENLGIFDFKLGAEEMAALDSVPDETRMLHFGHWPDKRE